MEPQIRLGRDVQEGFASSGCLGYWAGARTRPRTSCPMAWITAGRGRAALRMLMGAQLRRLPEACGITRVDAGEAIREPDSKISRSWDGPGSSGALWPISPPFTACTTRPSGQALLTLAAQAYAPGWWYADPRGDLKEPNHRRHRPLRKPPCTSRAGGGGQGAFRARRAGWRDQGRAAVTRWPHRAT